VDSVLLSNLSELWSQSWVVVMANSREQVMFDLEIQAKREVESELAVHGEVHGVLNLASGPALELLMGWSPLLDDAWNVADL
jgi:hypothetical protein